MDDKPGYTPETIAKTFPFKGHPPTGACYNVDCIARKKELEAAQTAANEKYQDALEQLRDERRAMMQGQARVAQLESEMPSMEVLSELADSPEHGYAASVEERDRLRKEVGEQTAWILEREPYLRKEAKEQSDTIEQLRAELAALKQKDGDA